MHLDDINIETLSIRECLEREDDDKFALQKYNLAQAF